MSNGNEVNIRTMLNARKNIDKILLKRYIFNRNTLKTVHICDLKEIIANVEDVEDACIFMKTHNYMMLVKVFKYNRYDILTYIYKTFADNDSARQKIHKVFSYGIYNCSEYNYTITIDIIKFLYDLIGHENFISSSIMQDMFCTKLDYIGFEFLYNLLSIDDRSQYMTRNDTNSFIDLISNVEESLDNVDRIDDSSFDILFFVYINASQDYKRKLLSSNLRYINDSNPDLKHAITLLTFLIRNFVTDYEINKELDLLIHLLFDLKQFGYNLNAHHISEVFDRLDYNEFLINRVREKIYYVFDTLFDDINKASEFYDRVVASADGDNFEMNFNIKKYVKSRTEVSPN